MLVNLIRPPNPGSIDDLLDEPLGLLYLASSLRIEGYDVVITDLAGEDVWDIPEANIYGIQLFTPTAHLGVRIAEQIKKEFPYSLVVAGGPHVSACPNDETLNVFDIIFSGEGEEAFANVIRNHGTYDPRVVAPFIEDLDVIPFPARDLVDMNRYHRKVDGHRSFGMVGSRGCPHHCTFCDRSLFGNKIRFRSIINIVEEIRHIVESYDVRHFEFFDDMFPGTVNRAREFSEMVEGMNLNFRCNARTDTANPEYYSLLKKAGCSMIYFGLESGSQKLLDLMKKGTTIEKNLNAIKTAQDAGLKVGGYFILGFPGEREETIAQSVDFIERSGIDQAQFYMFIPLPGAEVYKNLEKYGAKLLTKDFSEYYHVAGVDGHGGRVIETKWLSADQMQEEMQKIRKYLRERGSKGEMQDYYKSKLKYKTIDKEQKE